MRREHADGLAALDEQRLVVPQPKQGADDRAQRLVAARRAARSAVDHELVRPLGDVRVEVVEEHAERRLRLPGTGVQLGPARRADARQVAAERLDPLVDARRRAHGSRRLTCASRSRQRHQLHAVAPTNAAAEIPTARAMSPPVSQATTRITAAIAR